MAIALKMFVLVRSNNYDVVHCIEESAYIASIFRHWLGCPFVYDVDSSIPAQLSEKGGISAALAPLARGFETFALNKCLCAVTVCSALTEIVKRHAPGAPVFQIEDPPMIDEQRYTELEIAGLKRELQAADRKIVLYIGNFESYQGVELLMKSFAAGGEKIFPAILVIIGGSAEDVESKRRLAKRLGIADRVKFTGLLPPEQTGIYLEAADVLVSPRLKGDNTPMKIYTYMASGTAILATDLFTHTQVLDTATAYLVPPEEKAVAKGLEKLLSDDTLRRKSGSAALKLLREKYSSAAYTEKVKELYVWINQQLQEQKNLID